MGGAFSAVADDITAAYWNPAGLASVRTRSAAFMHSERFGGLITYDYLAYSQEYAGDVYAASLFRTDAGNIADTSDLQWYDTGSDGVSAKTAPESPVTPATTITIPRPTPWEPRATASGTPVKS